MGEAVKQHLIDPEICIRCHTCENTCPIEAITHNDDNVVVDASTCNFCMECIPVCPTGSIDEWRMVETPYSLDEQLAWTELPEQAELGSGADNAIEALDDAIAALLAEAHKGAGGKAKAPASATKPTVNLYNMGNPVEAVVQGNYRLTHENSDADVRHIILSFEGKPFPALEGQSLGILPPGLDASGKPHLPWLYSISSPPAATSPSPTAWSNSASSAAKPPPAGTAIPAAPMPAKSTTPSSPTSPSKKPTSPESPAGTSRRTKSATASSSP